MPNFSADSAINFLFSPKATTPTTFSSKVENNWSKSSFLFAPPTNSTVSPSIADIADNVDDIFVALLSLNMFTPEISATFVRLNCGLEKLYSADAMVNLLTPLCIATATDASTFSSSAPFASISSISTIGNPL